MAAHPFYLPGKGLWACKVKRNGQWKRLDLCVGKDTKKDYDRALAIMKKRCPPKCNPKLGEYQKLKLYAEFFIEQAESKYKPEGWRSKEFIIRAFIERWKRLDVCDLMPLHLTTWLDEKKYGNNRYNFAMTVIQTMFNWGVRQGVLDKNPTKGIKMKPRKRKTMDCLVTDEQHHALLKKTNKEGRRILTALFETGCRPGELQKVRKHHYQPEIRAWVFAEGEAKVANRKIYLSKTMVEMTDMLIARGRDYLFFNPSSKQPWAENGGTAIGNWFYALKRRAGIECAELQLYSYRHRFGTNLILKDVHLSKIAELMGHTSIKMLEEWYAHIKGQHTVLTDVLDQVSP